MQLIHIIILSDILRKVNKKQYLSVLLISISLPNTILTFIFASFSVTCISGHTLYHPEFFLIRNFITIWVLIINISNIVPN